MKSYNGFSPQERIAGDKIIKQAIKDGVLESLDKAVCVTCGQDKGIRHYHCEDYSPQNIIADSKCMCWRCHMILHSRFRFPKQAKKYFEEVKQGKRYAPVYRNNFDILKKEHGME